MKRHDVPLSAIHSSSSSSLLPLPLPLTLSYSFTSTYGVSSCLFLLHFCFPLLLQSLLFIPLPRVMAAGKSLRGSPIIATAPAREGENIITDIINSLAEAGAALTRNSSVLLAANCTFRPKCKVCLGCNLPAGPLNCDISPSAGLPLQILPLRLY